MTKKTQTTAKPKIDLSLLDTAFFTSQKVYSLESASADGSIMLSNIMYPKAFTDHYASPNIKALARMGLMPSFFGDMVESLLDAQEKQRDFFKNFDMSVDAISLKKEMITALLTKDFDHTEFFAFFDLQAKGVVIPQVYAKNLAKADARNLTVLFQKDAPFFIDDQNVLVIKCRFPQGVLTTAESLNLLKAQTNPRYNPLFAEDLISERIEHYKAVQEESLAMLTDEEIEKRARFIIDFANEIPCDEFICEFPLDSLYMIADEDFDYPYIWENDVPTKLKIVKQGIPFFSSHVIVINQNWIDKRILVYERSLRIVDDELDSLLFSLNTFLDTEKAKRNSAIEKSVITALESTLENLGDTVAYLTILRAIGEQADVLHEKAPQSRLFEKLTKMYETFATIYDGVDRF